MAKKLLKKLKFLLLNKVPVRNKNQMVPSSDRWSNQIKKNNIDIKLCSVLLFKRIKSKFKNINTKVCIK